MPSLFNFIFTPLLPIAIAGQDPNWGRIAMAIGKSGVNIKLNKLGIEIGNVKIVQNGKLNSKYSESDASNYMKNDSIELKINIGTGTKEFTAYTMDLTKKYVEINGDYRS